MKKVEKVEVKYIKMDTVVIIAIVCLLVGFIGGNVYSLYKQNKQMSGVSTNSGAMSNAAMQQAGTILNLERTVSADPSNAAAWLQLADLYFDTEKYQDAINAYRKYLAINPNNPNAWTDLGVMFRRNKQPNEAISAFEKAIEINSRQEQARFNKGIVLMYDLGKREEAIQAWQELNQMNPSFRTPGGQTIGDFLDKL